MCSTLWPLSFRLFLCLFFLVQALTFIYIVLPNKIILKMTVLWDVVPCNLVEIGVSEVLTVFIVINKFYLHV